jgi:hypothetical protein
MCYSADAGELAILNELIQYLAGASKSGHFLPLPDTVSGKIQICLLKRYISAFSNVGYASAREK